MTRRITMMSGLLGATLGACSGGGATGGDAGSSGPGNTTQSADDTAGSGGDDGGTGGDDGAGSGDPGDTGSPDTGDPDPVECVESERLRCFPVDLGPTAVGDGWEGEAVLVAGTVLAFPFSHGPAADGEQYGRVVTVAATGASEQGYDKRQWFSRAPAGPPLDGDCAFFVIADDVIGWNQNKDVSGYCRLPDAAGMVYLNQALCTSAEDDFHCAGPQAEFAPEDYRFRIASNAVSY